MIFFFFFLHFENENLKNKFPFTWEMGFFKNLKTKKTKKKKKKEKNIFPRPSPYWVDWSFPTLLVEPR